jgi:predicted transcriptional regulator
MNVAWDRGEASLREVMDAVNPCAPAPRADTTYIAILSRLTEKRLVARRQEGKTGYFRVAHTREECADPSVEAEVKALVGTFGDVALSHIARQMAELDPGHRRALERARER